MKWFEDPRFWEGTAFFMFDTKRLARAVEEVDGAVDLLDVEPGEHVLDLCCGPGRHAVELRRRGFAVTGVDLHPPFLDAARAKDASVEWVRADMREFRRPSAFDAAINVYSSFGYFDDPEDDARVLRNVQESLRAGGRFLVDTMSKEVLARKYEPQRWEELDDGTLLLHHVRVRDGWRGVTSTWTVLQGDERREFTFESRLYAGTELEDALLAAGFSSVRLYGGLDGRPYDHEAKRLVAVAAVDREPR